MFVAQDKGFFAKNGVDVKVEIRNTGSELSKGLRAGEFDFAPAAFTNLPAALERGLDVRGIVGYVGAAFEKTTADKVVALIASKDSGINSVADLAARTESELMSIRNFGQTSLNEIKRRLTELGVSLRTTEG